MKLSSKSDMSNATARPWELNGPHIFTPDVLPLPLFPGYYEAAMQGSLRIEAEANAALIVLSVNLHDELVASLRKLLNHCETAFTGWPHSLGAVDARAVARAVLAKVESHE